jgi:hypothetical protein
VLHLADRLYVIEAKVLAGRHDAGPSEDAERPRDQLVREWMSVAGPLGPGPAAPAGLTAALGSARPSLVYVVDHRRINSAAREFEESLSLVPPDSDLRLRTWQGLHRRIWLLAKSAGPWLWARDLLAYLDLVGLSGFTGFSTPAATAAYRQSVETWNRRASPGQLQLRGAVRAPAVLRGRLSIAALSISGSPERTADAAPPRSLGLRASVHSVVTLGPGRVRDRIRASRHPHSESGDQHARSSP